MMTRRFIGIVRTLCGFLTGEELGGGEHGGYATFACDKKAATKHPSEKLISEPLVAFIRLKQSLVESSGVWKRKGDTLDMLTLLKRAR